MQVIIEMREEKLMTRMMMEVAGMIIVMRIIRITMGMIIIRIIRIIIVARMRIMMELSGVIILIRIIRIVREPVKNVLGDFAR